MQFLFSGLMKFEAAIAAQTMAVQLFLAVAPAAGLTAVLAGQEFEIRSDDELCRSAFWAGLRSLPRVEFLSQTDVGTLKVMHQPVIAESS